MNKFYLSFIKNTLLSSKPSTAIRLLLMVLFVCSFVNVASAVTITITSNTNWSAITGGSGPGGLPNNTDDIVVRGNATLTVNVNNAICASLQLGKVGGAPAQTGALIFATSGSPVLTVTGAVIVGGSGRNGSNGTITFVSGSSLIAGSVQLGGASNTTNGTITMTAGSTLTNNGAFTIGAGTGTKTWTPSTGTVVLTATNTLPNTIFTSFNNLTINSGTTTAAVGFSVAGVLNIAASTTLNMSTFAMTGAGLTTLGTGLLRTQNTTATPIPSGRTWSGTVQYDGAGQTVMAGTYGSLTISGSGTKAAAGNIIVNNDFTLTAGTFRLNNATSYSLTILGNYLQTGGIFDFNTGTTGTSNMFVAGNLTNTNSGLGSLTTFGAGAPNGNIVFNGTGGLQVINIPTAAAADWVNYRINTGSNVALSSNLLLTGENTTNGKSQVIISGTLDLGTYTVTAASTYSDGAAFTLNSGATLITANALGINGSVSSTNTTRVFNTDANYVFNGTLAQVTSTGMPATVSNLTINNTAGLTLGQATTITNNFSIASGSIAYLGNGLTHTAGTLLLGGVAQVPESWGSTTSPADNKNDTYFAATTTGIVNNSCVKPTITTQPAALTVCENTGGSFSVVATGASTYQWQYSGDNTNWVNIDATLNPNPPIYVSGFTSNTLILTNTPAAWTNNYVRCIVRSSTGCRTNSNSVLLTVNSSPATTAVITSATCNASDGAITIAGLENVPLEFKNTDSDYIDLGATYLSNRSAFTVEGWIKFNIADLAGTSRISLFGQNDVVEFGFINPTTIELYTAGGGSFTTPIPASLGNNAWHHIAAVGNGTNMIIYIDGVSVGTGGSATGNYGNSADTSKIGAGVIDATGGGFTGQIKKVGFYNTALSAATIISLASTPTTYTGSESGLLAGYNFSEGVGTTLTKLPTVGFNGTLTNSPQWIYTYAWTKTGTPAYTASTKNITGLSSGEYNLSVGIIGTSCTKTTSYSVSPTNVYSSSWSLGTPTADQDIEFTGSYSDATDITACSCTVTSGTVTIPTGNYLKLGGKLTVNTPGTLTFENNASLVQTAFTGANTGDITYQRASTTNREFDYTYWSSPVVGQKLLDVSPSTKLDKFFSFDGTNWVQVADPANTKMTVGKGYIIRGVPMPNPVPPGFLTKSFIGEPNNGPQSIAVAGGQTSNLIGNPYPSAIDADAFILANTSSIDGTLYFWTHNTPIAIGTPDPGTGVWAYSGNDYATYTLSGGVATKVGNITLYVEWVDANQNRIVDSGEYSEKNGNSTLDTGEWIDSNSNKILETGEWTDTNKNNIAETGEWTDIDKDGILDLPAEWSDTNSNGTKDFGEWTDTNNNGVFNTGEWTDTNGNKILNLEVDQISNRPTGKIAAGQSFFTTSTTTGETVNFTNSMRVDGSGNPFNNTQFYKTKNPKAKTTTTVEKNRVWLNLTNKEGAFKQTLVGYITGATNTLDKLYDGESFDGNDFLDFYSINEEKNLTIQGRALPFDENDEIPLGYRIAVEGTFTINIGETDGLLANQAIFLEDKLTNTVFDLKTGNYTFNTAAGTFDDRFVLRYTSKTLGTNDLEISSNKVLVSIKNKQIKIDSFAETIDGVAIYDEAGRQIYQKNKVNSNELLISNFVSSHQILIVKTTLQNGKTVSNKIVY